jgi:hypothetical protein
MPLSPGRVEVSHHTRGQLNPVHLVVVLRCRKPSPIRADCAEESFGVIGFEREGARCQSPTFHPRASRPNVQRGFLSATSWQGRTT